jgi:hypothetical protein
MVVKERDFALNIVGLEGIKTPFLWLHLAGDGVFSFALPGVISVINVALT